jgi:beta-glucosidase
MQLELIVSRPTRITAVLLSSVCICLPLAPWVHAQSASGLLSSPTQTGSTKPTGQSFAERPWMDKSLPSERRADLLVQQMTPDEKIAMMHGVNAMTGDPVHGYDFVLPSKGYVGYVPPIRRLGIPALTLADGRAGVGNKAKDVTLLPAPIAAASSWDPSLLNEFGRVLGQEQWSKGTNVALGPSIDVVRVPEWGRTFESYGEDPYFNGVMAAAEIKGIQGEGPIADANMYVTMNQESDRYRADSVVDERTLHEIYLPPFEAAVRDGHVGTFMCAYVKTNSIYSCENANLLHHLLRDQLKFDGWVMSDWGATHSTVDSAKNGLDQQMPDDTFFGETLKNAVKGGQVSESIIDEHVHNILVPMFQHGLFDKTQTGTWTSNVRSPEHDSFSRMVAEQGTILLKNDQAILPVSDHASIAVIGEAGSTKPKIEGGGSSAVIAPYVISPLDGIRKRARASQVPYADGKDLAAASKTAAAAQIAIVFVHTNETEGEDRPDLELPENQDQLVAAVAAANKHTIVVLDTGGPVLMPWATDVAGIIEAWYPGQEDGNAIAAVVYGDFNPSAKLPLTFPKSAAEIPTAQKEQWPGVGGRSLYTERLNVGYRWYDATHTEPLFPFGFGLSYTTFQLSHLVVEPTELKSKPGGETGNVLIKLDVTNTGKRMGGEVVQAYVGQPPSNGEPPHQLRAFTKVELHPGETKSVSLVLDERSFATFDPGADRWIFPDGEYEVFVGTSSRDLPLHSRVVIGPPGNAQ